MTRDAFWIRAIRRLARKIEAARHAAGDARLARSARSSPHAVTEDLGRVEARLGGEGPEPLVLERSPAERLSEIVTADPGWRERAVGDAAEAAVGRISLFGRIYPLADANGWHRDPLRARPWPRRNHARIRLDDPNRPGDVRMQWEPARFHHAPLLGRAALASGDPEYAGALLAQIDAFARGCAPFRTIHWAVGMEVAIRATAWIIGLEFLRGSPALTAAWRERIARLLYLHGLFLETHIERHPLGFTTNHTIADHAGLVVLGRLFRGGATGARWTSVGRDGLRADLAEQILPGGAHAEGSLPYARFVLEAGLVAASCLPPADRWGIDGPLLALASHLGAARLGTRLPFVGDGDESFFPPFALRPFDRRDPLDPEAALQAAERVLGVSGLRARSEPEEAAVWLGAPIRGAAGASIPAPAETPGFVRFGAGSYRGLLITRRRGEGWRPTHAHNDLLSIVLDLNGEPLLIDPGTGAYGSDRRLRQALRATAAHSTLQVEEREQSPIEERRTFEGPAAVDGGIRIRSIDPPDIAAWHAGFGDALVHTRRIRIRRGILWIEDRLAASGGWDPGAPIASTIRYRLAGGIVPERMEGARRAGVSVRRAAGSVRFLLLRPTFASWQIGAEAASARYGSRETLPVLEASQIQPLPHRWVTAVYEESRRNR